MRNALWPAAPGEHAGEIERYFAGDLEEPVEVLLAFDASGQAIGLIELSIRNRMESFATDRIAYIEGWYVAPGRAENRRGNRVGPRGRSVGA